jgi:hypothetical protein
MWTIRIRRSENMKNFAHRLDSSLIDSSISRNHETFQITSDNLRKNVLIIEHVAYVDEDLWISSTFFGSLKHGNSIKAISLKYLIRMFLVTAFVFLPATNAKLFLKVLLFDLSWSLMITFQVVLFPYLIHAKKEQFRFTSIFFSFLNILDRYRKFNNFWEKFNEILKELISIHLLFCVNLINLGMNLSKFDVKIDVIRFNHFANAFRFFSLCGNISKTISLSIEYFLSVIKVQLFQVSLILIKILFNIFSHFNLI